MTDDRDAHALAARLFELINGAWTTSALAVAAELRLAEALRAGARHAGALAQVTGCDAQALDRLLRALCTIGVCEVRDDGSYALTPLGALLAEDSPYSLRSWALQFGRQLWPVLGDLGSAVRTGRGQRERLGEARGFLHLERDPEAAAVFNSAMVEITRIVADVAVRVVDLSGARRLVDVGGGHGQLLSAFLRRWPDATGVCLDLPHARKGAEWHFHDEGVSGRAVFVTGDFFVEVPAADVLLMKAILHDWPDAPCLTLLAHCRRALSTGGRLLVLDRVLPPRMRDDPHHRALARSDLTMLAGLGGRERTEADFRCLLKDAGFSLSDVRPLALDLSLLDCRAV